MASGFGQSASLPGDTPASYPGFYAWTCHQCTNINTVDPRNNERGYSGDNCEHDECKHKRCVRCFSTNGKSLLTTPLDRLPIRRGIKNYVCAFYTLPGCSKRHLTWLAAEQCARMHFTGSQFVSCTVPTCSRKFISLDHFRVHLDSHRDSAAEILPVEYPVLWCPSGTTTNCQEISTSLADLQQHFQMHLAVVPNMPQLNYIRDCTPRADGKFPCRYATAFNCNMVFNTPLPERQHFVKHFPQLLPCPLCEKSFRLPEWMAEHLNGHADAS